MRSTTTDEWQALFQRAISIYLVVGFKEERGSDNHEHPESAGERKKIK